MYFFSESSEGFTTITCLISGREYRYSNIDRAAKRDARESAIASQQRDLLRIGVPSDFFTVDDLASRYANGKLA